jgi:hypothetical protein
MWSNIKNEKIERKTKFGKYNIKIMNGYFKAKRIDNGEWVTGFFTKKKIGSLIVPVIEVYKEWDTGDYMDYYEIDGNTLENMGIIPIDAYALEVFAIKDSNDSPTGKEAYIGYKIENGNFNFISVPYTEPKEQPKVKPDSTKIRTIPENRAFRKVDDVIIKNQNKDWALDIAKKRFNDSYSWIFKKLKRKTK